MTNLKLLNLFAFATVAICVASFGVEPVNALQGPNLDSHAISRRSHHAMAKRKGSRHARRACRPRPPPAAGNNATNDNNNNGNSGSNDNAANNNNNNGNNSGGSSSSSSNSNGGNNGGGNNGGSAGQGSGNGKVCLAWPNGNDPALANFETRQSGYLYTWSPFMPQDLHGYKAAPMLWGPKQIDDFHANVKQGSADYILGFNEPEMTGQSNLSPQDAASLWKQHIQPYAQQGFKLVSPAVTSAPQSKPWLVDFFKACDGCTFDAVAVHYYDVSAQGLINYITDFHNTFQKPIWLTEYACQNFNNGPQCSPDEVLNFMKTVKTFAEGTDWVQQYCWFGAMHNMQDVNYDNQLMNNDGQPTFLGSTFLGLVGY